jgi:hypothetical protein
VRFKIVSVGWKCADWWRQTLASIESQSVDNWDVCVVYDGGDDAGPDIAAWCDEHGERWTYIENEAQHFAVRNQVTALTALAPEDDDIVVFLDLDGDQLAHRDVLRHLSSYYEDGTLLTYGSYLPVPQVSTCTPATPFPADVVAAGTYRRHVLTVGCCFNHLRTMSGRIANAIPASSYRWASGPQRGQWYLGGTDYVFMVAGLELAGGRYKYIPEVLLLYNHANPNADNLVRGSASSACVQDFLRRPPLSPLESVRG